MNYDYKKRKDKIIEMLDNDCEIQEKDVPKDDSNFTYDNGIRSWIGSIFVDIIDSKELIEKKEDIVVAKVLRIFTSEIICILNSSEQMRQIGVRGDCVYGIFSTPKQKDILELADMSFHINTLMKMINKLLSKKELPNIKAGIGVAAGEDLIIKAGDRGTGLNDKIWIGRAVVEACVLANNAGREEKDSIGFNNLSYNNFIEKLKERNKNKDVDSWFTEYIENNKSVYYANIIKEQFDDWIENDL